MWEEVRPSFLSLQESICNPINPIGMRMRAAYYLRQIYIENENESNSNENDESNQNEEDQKNNDNDNEENNNNVDNNRIIDLLCNELHNIHHGSLLRHEIAYILGQIHHIRACTTLENILLNTNHHNIENCSMVRHECAEALGAIGSISSISTLETVINETKQLNIPEIYETCQLAIHMIEYRNNINKTKEGSNSDDTQLLPPPPPPLMCPCMMNPYSTIDPAPSLYDTTNSTNSSDTISIQELGHILCNIELSLFERYRAMFTLRNIGTSMAIYELCKPLIISIDNHNNTNTNDNTNNNTNTDILLRHEIAYVLGQVQHYITIPILIIMLYRYDEHSMIRHECSEALGSLMDIYIDNNTFENDIMNSHIMDLITNETEYELVMKLLFNKNHENTNNIIQIIQTILEDFRDNDHDIIVRESCMVALDAADYWNQYNHNHIYNNCDVDDPEEKEVELVGNEDHKVIDHNHDNNNNNNNNNNNVDPTTTTSTSFAQQKKMNHGNNLLLKNHFNMK